MSNTRSKTSENTSSRTASLLEVCSVRIADRRFGVSIRHVLEILGKASLQPIPLAPSFVGGLVHYRGEVLTGVSLRHLLDMPARTGTQDILVLESPQGNFGLVVDAVGEVLTVDQEAYEANPSTLSERRRALFAGAYKLQNELIVMLDPEQLEPMRLAQTA